MSSKFNKITAALQQDEVNIKAVLAKLTSNWYLFVISTLICLSLDAVYVYFAPSEWKISSKILIEDQKNSSSPASINTKVSPGPESPANMKSNAENEIEVLKSRSLMAEVVEQMQLNVRTYLESGLKYKEIYPKTPFNITVHLNSDSINQQEYFIQIKDDTHYHIKSSTEDVDQMFVFGQSIKLPQFTIILNKTALIKKGERYKITIQSTDETVADLLDNNAVQLSNQKASSIDLSLIYPNPKKGEAILNKLLSVYLHNNLVNKNSIADSTIRFINKRLAVVNKRLSEIENQLQNYKQQNKIADVSKQSKILVAGAKDYYNKLNKIEVQLVIALDLNSYLNRSDNNKTIPSTLTAKDPELGKAINVYNDLIIRREKLSPSFNADTITLKKLSIQADTARIALLKNISSYQHDLLISKNKLDRQNASFTGKIMQVPVKERTFLDYIRQQNLQQELSLFLLKRREEIAISKTSANQSARIIDAAKSDFQPLKPKKSFIYTFGLIFGLILPAIYLFLKELFNIRINTKVDIEKITSIPIVGEISHNPHGKILVADQSGCSLISEQFKKISSSLTYIMDNQKSNVLLFTSSMSGEGKSFLSLNLGYALALSGKRVVFIELDLRKPKLSENVGINNSYGYSNYAVSDEVSIDSILKPLWFHKNCYMISSGEIPPNAAELLMNGKLEKLVNQLKKRFNYVIMDCSPVGLVSDAMLIEKLADLVFFVVRQKYTYKSQLGIVNDFKETAKVKNLYILINDVKPDDKDKSYFVRNFNSRNLKDPTTQTNLRNILPGN